jgi:enterochelin esterase family protein
MLRVHPLRVEFLPVESRALRGNPLGDPWRRELPVILPPGYGASRRRYPVIWVLAGFFGTGRMSLNRNYSAPALDERLAHLAAARRMPPAILALPDCMTSLGGSQYLDSPATGDYETHLCEELLPLADRELRTIPAREARGILGKSSGGYGALRLAMRRGDLFGAAASHSGDCYFEYCHLRDFPMAADAVRRAGGLRPFLRKVRSSEKPRNEDMIALLTVAMAACYSPQRNNSKRKKNPRGRSLRFDLPFDEETGEIRDAVFERWLPNDPVRMVENPRHADALRKLRLLFLDCGTRDQWYLHLGLRIFASRLKRKKIRFVHEEFDDDHMSISYRYDRSIPLVARALARD